MLTTSHMLIGAAATTRPGMRGWLITLGWLGGFFPDAPMFAMVGMSRMPSDNAVNLWREPDGLYWNDPWRTLIDAGHSIPIWSLVLVIGAVLWFRADGRWKIAGLAAMVFSGAALLHALCDFPVHAHDAHASFWPLSGWRFISPFSYYERGHYGDQVRLIEMAIGLAAAGYLAFAFKRWTIRILAGFLVLPYFLGFIYRYFF